MQKGEEDKIKIQAEAIKKLETKDFSKYCKMEADEALKSLGVDIKKGLSESEVKKRQEKYGPNELEKEEEESLWEKIKEAFEDLLARILLLAALISFGFALMGDGEEGLAAYVEPFVILLILILNAIVSIY